MQKLKISIQVPEGFEIEDLDKGNKQVLLREIPKNVTERIKTVEDVLSDHHITQEELNAMFDGVPEHLKHQYVAELLAASLNEGWKPNWDDSNEYKYFPWFEMGGSSGLQFIDYVYWGSHSSVGSRLCFRSRELAEYAGKQFTGLYKEFMIIQ
jgi:hypothetical protein